MPNSKSNTKGSASKSNSKGSTKSSKSPAKKLTIVERIAAAKDEAARMAILAEAIMGLQKDIHSIKSGMSTVKGGLTHLKKEMSAMANVITSDDEDDEDDDSEFEYSEEAISAVKEMFGM